MTNFDHLDPKRLNIWKIIVYNFFLSNFPQLFTLFIQIQGGLTLPLKFWGGGVTLLLTPCPHMNTTLCCMKIRHNSSNARVEPGEHMECRLTLRNNQQHHR